LRRKVKGVINGLQLSESVPMLSEDKSHWNVEKLMEPVTQPACQIHYTHNYHWVVSILHDNQIFLLDSLGNDRSRDRLIPHGLQIQLSVLYGKDKEYIDITIPTVMKQNNNVDCGVNAIAFATQYCLNKQLEFEIIFDSSKMRSHLMHCFEQEEISLFPVTQKTLSKRSMLHVKRERINNYCLCNLPECVDNMIQCDRCPSWYHRSCIKIPLDVSMNDKVFVCIKCNVTDCSTDIPTASN